MTTEQLVKLPPLESGDRLTRAEFERRYAAMPNLKKGAATGHRNVGTSILRRAIADQSLKARSHLHCTKTVS